MGAAIAEGRLDALFFFSDPMSAMPHDVDVRALVRLSSVYDFVLACTRTTPGFVLTSPRFDAHSPIGTASCRERVCQFVEIRWGPGTANKTITRYKKEQTN